MHFLSPAFWTVRRRCLASTLSAGSFTADTPRTSWVQAGTAAVEPAVLGEVAAAFGAVLVACGAVADAFGAVVVARGAVPAACGAVVVARGVVPDCGSVLDACAETPHPRARRMPADRAARLLTRDFTFIRVFLL
ncbi:hypothetical protein GCM10010515_11130 [Streptomyces fructofermentans]|uniref:Uncharacterized protein n=1 Tax=Streptomyces fructofermentans TaxID=152141 RepID=A0A918K3Y4_9ACTN|nr:hypothetical protein GCM10010515_11130 [Streptomyces fructofermentans]